MKTLQELLKAHEQKLNELTSPLYSDTTTPEVPSCFQVPTIPSPRLAVAVPSPDKVISNGFPAVSVTFHAPSNSLAAKQATAITPMAKSAAGMVLVAFFTLRMGEVLLLIMKVSRKERLQHRRGAPIAT